jgi:hypothetical protein
MADEKFVDARDKVTASLESLSQIANLPDVEISEEAMREFFQAISSANKTFKMNLMNFFHVAPKQYGTEYSSWITKNQRKVKTVDGMSYEAVKDIMIDLPTGMTAKYPEVASALLKGVNDLEIESVVKNALLVIDSIQASISNGSNNCERVVDVANAKNNSKFKMLMATRDAIDGSFDVEVSRSETKQFGDMFADMKELADTRKDIEEANETISTIPNLEKSISELEEAIDITVNYIVDDSEKAVDGYHPSPKFIKAYAKFIGDTETELAMYGDMLIRVLALTHNFTRIYDTVGK